MTSVTSYSFKIDSSKIYKALLCRINDYMVNGNNNLAEIKKITDCTRMMLCGKKSRDEKRGAYVDIKELNDNDKFNGYAFEKSYSDSAAIIYKD